MMKPRLVKISNGEFGVQVARWPVAKFADFADISYSRSGNSKYFHESMGDEQRARAVLAAMTLTWEPVK